MSNSVEFLFWYIFLKTQKKIFFPKINQNGISLRYFWNFFRTETPFSASLSKIPKKI